MEGNEKADTLANIGRTINVSANLMLNYTTVLPVFMNGIKN